MVGQAGATPGAGLQLIVASPPLAPTCGKIQSSDCAGLSLRRAEARNILLQSTAVFGPNVKLSF